MNEYLVCIDFGLVEPKNMGRDRYLCWAKGEDPTDAYQNAFDSFLKCDNKTGHLEEGIKSNDFEGAETAFIHPFKLGKKKYKKCLGLVFSQEKLSSMNFPDEDTQATWTAGVLQKLVDEAKEMNV